MGICFVGVTSAQGALWDGGGADDSWGTPENWDPDGVPGPLEYINIAGGGTAYIDANDIAAFRVDLAFGGAGDGHLTIHSGSLTAGSGIAMGQSAAGVGQLTINSGTVTVGAWGLYVGYQDATGIITINDGLLDASAVPMWVGFGTWVDTEVTKGYVYLHGGMITAASVGLTDQGDGIGTQEGLIELDGSGELRINGNVADEMNEHVIAGRIYGLNGQTVVAYYDGDLQKTVVRISPGAADCEEAKVVAAATGEGLLMDLDGDCYVRLSDVILFATDWLGCNDPLNDDCEYPWRVVE